MAKPVVAEITDHAVVRYLERVKGMNIEKVRADLRALVSGPAHAGATSVKKDGWVYLIRNMTLITVRNQLSTTAKGKVR